MATPVPPIYVEYIPVDERLHAQIKGIMESAVNHSDVTAALSHRLLMLRKFIAAWRPYVHEPFIRRFEEMIQACSYSASEMPMPPDINAYNWKTQEGIQEYVNHYNQAWNDLIAFFQSEQNKQQQANSKRLPIDKFYQINEMLEKMLLAVPVMIRKIVERNRHNYIFTEGPEWPHRMICKVEKENDQQYFRDLERQTENSFANEPMYKVYNSIDEIPAGPRSPRTQLSAGEQIAASTLPSIDENTDPPKGFVIHDGKQVPSVRTKAGVEVPKPGKNGKYGKTMLTRMARGHMTAIIEDLGITVDPKWNRTDMATQILEAQKKE